MKTTTHLNGVVSLVALSITACAHTSTKNGFPLSSARFALSRPRRSSSSPSAVALEQTNERHFVQQATWKRVWRANSIDGVSSCHVRKWWDIKSYKSLPGALPRDALFHIPESWRETNLERTFPYCGDYFSSHIPSTYLFVQVNLLFPYQALS
jgi:hypothetical protein